MRLLTPIIPDPGAPLGRANPVAKLGAALVILVALFASLDGVTAGLVLVALVALLPVSGLSARALLGRAWPAGVAAVSIGVFNVLFAGEQLGPTAVDYGPLRIGADTLVNGAGLALRLVAIVLAGLLATATSDPVDIADALVQQLRVSPRFAIGVLAALRLLPLLAREWQILGMARRARGVEAGRSPIAAIRLFAGAGRGWRWRWRHAASARRPAAAWRVRSACASPIGDGSSAPSPWRLVPLRPAWRWEPGARSWADRRNIDRSRLESSLRLVLNEISVHRRHVSCIGAAFHADGRPKYRSFPAQPTVQAGSDRYSGVRASVPRNGSSQVGACVTPT